MGPKLHRLNFWSAASHTHLRGPLVIGSRGSHAVRPSHYRHHPPHRRSAVLAVRLRMGLLPGGWSRNDPHHSPPFVSGRRDIASHGFESAQLGLSLGQKARRGTCRSDGLGYRIRLARLLRGCANRASRLNGRARRDRTRSTGSSPGLRPRPPDHALGRTSASWQDFCHSAGLCAG
jgi:hypothetical protein